MTKYHAAERANAALSKIRDMKLTTQQVLELAIAQSLLAVAEAAQATADANDRHTAVLTESVNALAHLVDTLHATDTPAPAADAATAAEDESAKRIAEFEAQIQYAKDGIRSLENEGK